MLQDSFFSPHLSASILTKLHAQNHKPGLYVIATPIGNIFDITLRAIHILRTAKLIFAEDTRESKKLLNFYDIDTPLVACHDHNESDTSMLNHIKPNNVYAIISDAGTPLISDPGYKIINLCIENNIDVFPVPGACSLVAALSASGMPTDNFTFIGFLPNKSVAKKNKLISLKSLNSTTIYFESPKRIVDTLRDMQCVFGNRKCCVCRELTKFFEEFKRGTISQCIEYFLTSNPLGEFVVLIEGEKCATIEESDLDNDLRKFLLSMSMKDAVECVTDKYNLQKKIVYEKALHIKRELDE